MPGASLAKGALAMAIEANCQRGSLFAVGDHLSQRYWRRLYPAICSRFRTRWTKPEVTSDNDRNALPPRPLSSVQD